MTTKGQHHKHPPIARPTRGMYHRSEWGIYGTTCTEVEHFVQGIQQRLGDLLITYVDADHSEGQLHTAYQVGKKKYSLPSALHWNEYDDRLQLWQSDAVLVNGNHYPAQKQIVILNAEKKASLERRLAQLTDVDMVILTDSCDQAYDFLTENISTAKIYHASEMDQIAEHIRDSIASSMPKVKAIVLAGGRSRRMGEDKATIAYHNGVPQQEYTAMLCHKMGLQTYISKDHEYSTDKIGTIPVIKDRFVDLGPCGAIMTAFMHDPDAAWLVLACDLPLIDADSIANLLQQRDASCTATAYQLSDQKWPEPLMAVYEPRAYQRMLRFLSMGYACPRKVLINSPTKTISLADESVAYNANTVEERQQAQKMINK